MDPGGRRRTRFSFLSSLLFRGGRTMRWVKVAAVVALLGGAASADDKERSVKFRRDDVGETPAGWKAARRGRGASVWRVVADDTAPSKTGLALAQTSDDRNALFTLCVADEPRLKDVEA